jgi:hypothetical protein
LAFVFAFVVAVFFVVFFAAGFEAAPKGRLRAKPKLINAAVSVRTMP